MTGGEAKRANGLMLSLGLEAKMFVWVGQGDTSDLALLHFLWPSALAGHCLNIFGSYHKFTRHSDGSRRSLVLYMHMI